MKHLISTITVLSLLGNPAFLYAEIYKTTDKDGNTIYTDTPPENAEEQGIEVEEVELPEITTMDQDRVQAVKNKMYFEAERDKEAQAKEAEQQRLKKKQAAKNQLKEAEKALEEAKVLRAGDYFKNLNGAIIHNDTYKNRVKSAEKKLEEAQKNYEQTP